MRDEQAMTIQDSDDPEIEALVRALYDAFDNRDSRMPSADALHALFTNDATITRLKPGHVDVYDRAAFIAPRVALLSGGALREFHEWEVEARTVVLGNIAARSSRYAKLGTLDGAEYKGSGRKLFQLYRNDGKWLISALLWEDDEV
jgi:hypothetical protein